MQVEMRLENVPKLLTQKIRNVCKSQENLQITHFFN